MKQQSLERILAENMLRFGTKNLGDTISTVKRLVEQLGAGDGVGAGVNIPADMLALIKQIGPTCSAYKNGVTQLKNMKIPVLCNGSIIDALIYGAFKGNAAQIGYGKIFKQLGMTKKFNEKLKSVLDGLHSESFMFKDADTVTFNPYPEDPTLVATIGEVTAAMGVSGAEQAGSSYNELLTYLNTYNLMNAMATQWTENGVQQYIFTEKPEDNQDENGFLDLDARAALWVYRDICFYATAQVGVSKAGKNISTSKFIPVAGDKQTVPIAPDTFPQMGVTVADGGWSKITSHFEGFKSDPKFGGAGWKIKGITVNTAASLGEKVTANVAEFSRQTGVPVQDLTKAGITDTNVKDPVGLAAGPAKAGRSGQDFLAITRANNIKQKLEVAYPGIPVTTNPMLALGAAAGRYGSVDFTVEGPSREESIPASMVSTGKVGGTENLEKVFNCYRVDSNYPLATMFLYKDAYEKGDASGTYDSNTQPSSMRTGTDRQDRN